jgi:uncharacterized delta-60 repeat protein
VATPTAIYFAPDNQPVPEVLGSWLSAQGLTALVLHDEAQLMALSLRRRPRVIAMDARTSPGPCLTACKRMKGDSYTGVVPCIIFAGDSDDALGVALQGDGKIVVSGVAGAPRSNKSVALVRYNANGSLDTSFSGDGKVMRNLTPGWDDASGVEIQADGKIVTAGAVGGLGGQLLVLRFEADGTPDTTFSGDGKVATNFTARDDFAWDLALQADGKIVAAGTSGIGTTGAGSFAVARYGAAGVLYALERALGGSGERIANLDGRWFDVTANGDTPGLSAEGIADLSDLLSLGDRVQLLGEDATLPPNL